MLSNDGGALTKTCRLEQRIPIAGESMSQWFAAYTMPRHEKRIAEQCVSIGIEHFLPLYTLRKLWKNRVRVDVCLPLFPNYIFVHLAPGGHTSVLKIPGVLSLLRNATGSAVIPDQDVHALRRAVRCSAFVPHPYVGVGDSVRINRGPLQGLAGTVLRSNNGWRFVITLEPIGKSMAVDVDRADLDLLNSTPLSPEPMILHA